MLFIIKNPKKYMPPSSSSKFNDHDRVSKGKKGHPTGEITKEY